MEITLDFDNVTVIKNHAGRMFGFYSGERDAAIESLKTCALVDVVLFEGGAEYADEMAQGWERCCDHAQNLLRFFEAEPAAVSVNIDTDKTEIISPYFVSVAKRIKGLR